MLEGSLAVYLVPFMLANGTTTYILSKKSEKKIIARFDNIKIIHSDMYKGQPIIPEVLKKHVQVIENNIDKQNLNNLYNNLANVKLQKNMRMLLLGIKGKYNSERNELSYSIDGSIEHEIIHLASAYYDEKNNICQSGFVNYDKNLTIGKALNEGYTDLTARRLFNKKTSFYNDEVRIVQFIELLFDKNKLQRYFFNNDIVTVVNTLCKYMKRDEAIKLLITFDLAFDLKKQGNPLYKVVYTNLELKICKLFQENNKDLKKQQEYNDLLKKTIITNSIYKLRK